MLKPIMNVADVSLEPLPPEFAPTGPAAERFEAKTGSIGAHIGARNLGYNVSAVPPGKRAWPFHNHPAKEEMFFVLHAPDGTPQRFIFVGRETQPAGFWDGE